MAVVGHLPADETWLQRVWSRGVKRRASGHIWLPAVSAAPDVLPIEGHVTDDERTSRDIRLEEETQAADLDLPASQRPAGIGVGFRACGNPTFLQGELALHGRLVQEDSRDKLGLVQQPVAVLKLERHTGDGETSDL